MLKKTFNLGVYFFSFILLFWDDSLINKYLPKIFKDEQYTGYNILIYKVIIFIIFFLISFIFNLLYNKVIWYKKINFKGHEIEIRYGDLLKSHKGSIVINFDECFTTSIGENSSDIKPSSLCGQFLLQHQTFNIEKIIKSSNVSVQKRKSEYNHYVCYKPGSIIKYEKFLFMAFARLDSNGNAKFNDKKDFINCLDNFWKELYNKHGDCNVCMPILGSSRTKIGDTYLTEQQALDLILFSYKISDFKLQRNYKLIIYCKRNSNFSLHNIS